MRTLWLVLLVGCGGGQTARPQPVANTVPTPLTDPPPSASLDAKVCTQKTDEFGPVVLTDSQVVKRNGAGAAKFSQIPTTKDAPIEVCSPSGEIKYLRAATCDDGSHPTSAERSGNVGPGGRCGSIIDLYVAVCPEKQYDVYMDMYMCGPGENFMQ